MDKLEDYFRREEESLLKKEEEHPKKEVQPHTHPHHLKVRLSKFARDAALVVFCVFLTLLLISMFKQQEKVDPEMEKRILKLLKDREEQKRLRKQVEEAERRGIDTEGFIK